MYYTLVKGGIREHKYEDTDISSTTEEEQGHIKPVRNIRKKVKHHLINTTVLNDSLREIVPKRKIQPVIEWINV